MGHVSIRNPLQAPKERSCGTSITSPSLGSAKRDRLSSSTSYGMRQSPLRGTIFRWRCSTYPQLRCFAACSGFHYIGPAPRNPQLRLDLGLTVRGCVATARRHSLLKVNQSLFSYKTATFVTSFICYVVSLRSIHTLISFDTHIHIVRYTHSYRTM